MTVGFSHSFYMRVWPSSGVIFIRNTQSCRWAPGERVVSADMIDLTIEIIVFASAFILLFKRVIYCSPKQGCYDSRFHNDTNTPPICSYIAYLALIHTIFRVLDVRWVSHNTPLSISSTFLLPQDNCFFFRRQITRIWRSFQFIRDLTIVRFPTPLFQKLNM
jgi:hypothetical protein